jgi:hypothetical protein
MRRLRALVTPTAEYRLRRAVNRLLPVRHRSGLDQLYHACVWKTASQWVRIVLSDPRLYRYSGLSPHLADDHLRPDPAATRFPSRGIVTALMRDYAFFAAVPKPERWRAFFVKRDPRDLLVSFYFSNRYSHRPNPGILQVRAELSGLSDAQGLLKTLERFAPLASILTSWQDAAAADANIVLVRYEDLTGDDQLRHWQALLDGADIALPSPLLRRVLATYSFARMSGGRRRGEADPHDKYRQGLAGDWRNHFDAALTAAFRRQYPDLVERLGYGW